jgi:hypothetical protein
MNVFWAMCLVVASVGVAVAAILLVRRRAPDGGCFNDSDRASGVFGVLATGFAITIGFVVFLAFNELRQLEGGRRLRALRRARGVAPPGGCVVLFAASLFSQGSARNCTR